MPGRPRKPNHLHLVQGTNRASRHDLANAPQPVADCPPSPDHLTPLAKEAWDRFVPLIYGMGILTTVDGAALERGCEAYAEIRETSRVLELEGFTYQTKTITGEVMWRARPEFAQRADADRRFAAFLSQFGLTPAARTKVKVNNGPKNDPIDKYFAG